MSTWREDRERARQKEREQEIEKERVERVGRELKRVEASKTDRERQFDRLVTQFLARIQQYEKMADWLTTIQQSSFDADTIYTVRTQAREERLSAIGRQVKGDLSTLRRNRQKLFRPALDIMAELDMEDESVYDSVLLACDTAEPRDLESALATVRYCQSRAEEGVRTVPDMLAQQQRKDAAGKALTNTFAGVIVGLLLGAVGGMLACVGVWVSSSFGAGVNTFVACGVIGSVLGGAIGYARTDKGPGRGR